MSAKATFWAWDQTGVSGNEKLVLLCYAQYANDQDVSWPSKNTIAIKCGISKSTVKRVVKVLCDKNYMQPVGSAYSMAVDNLSRETIRYKLNCRCNVNRVQNEPGSNKKQPGSSCSTSRVTVNPKPISKPIKEPINKNNDYAQLFEQFWLSWPGTDSKGSKQKALNEFVKQVELSGSETPSLSADSFVLGALMAAELQQAAKAEIRSGGGFASSFPHVCNWLAQQGWKDDLDQPQQSTGGAMLLPHHSEAENV